MKTSGQVQGVIVMGFNFVDELVNDDGHIKGADQVPLKTTGFQLGIQPSP